MKPWWEALKRTPIGETHLFEKIRFSYFNTTDAASVNIHVTI
jgi:hypothetical protein